ncbi:hypothetical protein VTJ04DRAFT_8990 [Mycothermus thermophilus]|uniref:uncharacterized protein n=1 Tax=Humicola insolens TaxID=85995 RepID=UPI003741ECD1
MPPNPKTGSSANAGEGKTPTPRKSVWNHRAHLVLLMEFFNILTTESKISVSQYKDQLEGAMKANGMSFSFDAIRFFLFVNRRGPDPPNPDDIILFSRSFTKHRRSLI